MHFLFWLTILLVDLRNYTSEAGISPAPGSLLETSESEGISFSVVGKTSVQLPQESLQLKIVLNSTQDISNVTYYWELIEGDKVGSTETTYTEPVLSLVNLKSGKARWRATVRENDKSAFKDVLITILPYKKPNRPPKVHINPSSPIFAVEGNQIVLDGQGSIDEDGNQLEFEWKLLHGPAFELSASKSPVLRLDNLNRGNYTFSLTVKDDQGGKASGTVDVIVSAKRDDPPKAQITDCNDQTIRTTIDIRLPLKTLTLCANTSTDDYGIVSYKWFRIDNLTSQLAIDFQGSTSSVLSLTNLQPNENIGPYIFQLTVFDGNLQNDSAKVAIMVNKAVNHVPIPYAGPNQTVTLPFESVVLTGSVKDDGQIVTYEWTQLSGPSTVKLINQDKIKCTAKGFQEGIFKFRLNVTDDGGLTAVSDTFVNVTRSQNEHPVARAENVTIYLPANLAVLNGSKSTDDAGIVRYLWTPHDDVPACIDILGDSFNKPELFLSGLVPGDFLFDLTVSDHSEAKNTTTVLLTVIASDEYLNSVEMFIKEDSANITYRLRDKLKARIVAAVVSRTEASSVIVHFSHFAQEPRTGKLRVVFYVKYETDTKSLITNRDLLAEESVSKVMIGNEMVHILREEVNMIQDFRIQSIEPLFCTLDCSGHGSCNNFSKECVCDTYWMPNLFRYYLSGGSHDCSWSMLYFGITTVVVMIILPRLLYCVICHQRRIFSKWKDVKRVNMRRRKRRRFRRNDENTGSALTNGNGKKNDQSSSYSLLIGSDSLSSDTEIDQVKDVLSTEKRNGVDRGQKSASETDLHERFSTISFD